MIKRVVIVGADFPPSSYPPALRIRFFSQHLPAFGWQPTVVTINSQYYEWPVDPEHEQLVPQGLDVIRTPALPAKLTRQIGIGDLGMRTLWHHWRAIKHLCQKSQVDLVFIPVPPFVPMVLGRWLYESFGIPYVIDYIDPWVTDTWRSVPQTQRLPKRAWADALSRMLEPFALKQVSHIVAVDKAYTEGVVNRYAWLSDTDTTGIPYGAEPDDFAYLRQHPRPSNLFSPADGFVHVSSVGRGGWDMIPALRAVFQAIQLGLQRSPTLFNRLRLHFVGTTYAANGAEAYQVLPLAKKMGLEKYVDEHPARVAYLDALQVLLDSHVLLAVGSTAPHYTASKIFPYILAKKPLLAVFHEASSVVKILRETHAGQVITFTPTQPPQHCVEEISFRLEGFLTCPEYPPTTHWKGLEPYSTRSMTARLAQVFDRVWRQNESPGQAMR